MPGGAGHVRQDLEASYGRVKARVHTCDGPPASQMYEWVKKERIMYALCHSPSEMRCFGDSTGN